MTTGTSPDGPLGWLPSAQQSYNLGLDLWQPLEARLTAALAGMHEETFLICQIPGPEAPGGDKGNKYLQYAVSDGEHGRQLIAEASALKFQGVTDPTAQAQQALIDAMGWTRPDDDNHRRLFSWPLGVHEAVHESMRILRDIWGVTHPSLVRIGEPTAFGQEPLSASLGVEAINARLTAWVELLGGSAQPPPGDAGSLLATVMDVVLGIELDLDDERLDLGAVVGVLPRGTQAFEQILRAVSEEALVGCVRLSKLESADELFELYVSVPVEGLSVEVFGRHLTWLASSCSWVERRLHAAGVLRGLVGNP